MYRLRVLRRDSQIAISGEFLLPGLQRSVLGDSGLQGGSRGWGIKGRVLRGNEVVLNAQGLDDNPTLIQSPLNPAILYL